jgi:hypothetical protein
MEPNELFTNRPYFDFYEAIENYGLDFEQLSGDSFSQFIRDSLITDFIVLRKSFLLRNYKEVRDKAHKLKGCFAYLIL